MNKITFVTSMNEEGFKLYGKKMLEAVDKYWDKGLQLICGFHDFDIHEYDPPVSDVISYRNLNEINELIEYREQFKKYDGTQFGNGYNWRMDAIKWCHKVFCIGETAFEMAEQEIHPGWLVWLDADTLTQKPFSASDLAPYLNDKVSIVHLGRTATDYSETSFIAFNLNRENPVRLIADLVGAYISGEVLTYREWHDGFIFERLLNIYKAHGTETHNLTPHAKTLDAFGVSPLSQWMEHFKGNKKNKAAANDDRSNTVAPDVNGPKRYGQLLKIVQHYNVESVVETGTWNGGRAIQMAEAAFANGKEQFSYTGFDLFEEATDETDKKELNTKAHNSYEAVSNRLREYQERKAEEGKVFNFALYKGDTNVTVLEVAPEADLAYIDGGHSYGTTKSDWLHITAPVVVFDDFFSKDSNGNIPDEDGCGTNQVIDEVVEEIKSEELGWRVKVLPSTDGVRGGGITHLAVVIKEDDLPDLPSEFYRVPIVVTPKDCMPDDYILNNVKENLKRIPYDNWVHTCGLTEDHLIIVSGGNVNYETLQINLENMKADGIGYKVACVKHSLPKLMKHKIVPDYCVVLDPRPIEGESTHGIKRKDLFKKFSKRKTTFLVASMTDTSVVDYLLENGAKIKLWHAYSEAIRDKSNMKELKLNEKSGIDKGTVFVTGGTCAAMRTFGMFHILGFRHFHFYGFDCSILNMTEEMSEEVLDTGQKKYFKVEIDGEIYWTTGELLAMAQDCEKLFDRKDIDFKIHFHANGPSLVHGVWQTSPISKELDYTEVL